jgi:hypothetical protein
MGSLSTKNQRNHPFEEVAKMTAETRAQKAAVSYGRIFESA